VFLEEMKRSLWPVSSFLTIEKAREFLNERGNASRNNHNTLTFLAADRAKLENLKRSVRRFLAWEAICSESESETLNLDAYQRKLARTKNEVVTIFLFSLSSEI
jgi:hypothetical protein